MHFFKVKFIKTCLIFNKSQKFCFCVHDYCGEAVYDSKESGGQGILGNIYSLTAQYYFLWNVILSVTPWGTPFYKPYRYMPPQRVLFLRCFSLKTGINFTRVGRESGMVVGGTSVEHILLSLQFQMNKKEREMWEFEMDFTKSLLLAF